MSMTEISLLLITMLFMPQVCRNKCICCCNNHGCLVMGSVPFLEQKAAFCEKNELLNCYTISLTSSVL